MDLLLQRLNLDHSVSELPLEVIYLLLQLLPVGIESALEVGCLLLGLSLLHLGPLELLLLPLKGLLSSHLLLQASLLLLHLLVESQNFGALCKVLLKSLILKLEIVKLRLHGLILHLSHITISITLEDVDLALQLVILLVEEVHLILQL